MKSCTLLLVVGLLAVSISAAAEDGASDASGGLAPTGPALAPSAPIGQNALPPPAPTAEPAAAAAPVLDAMPARAEANGSSMSPTADPMAAAEPAAGDGLAMDPMAQSSGDAAPPSVSPGQPGGDPLATADPGMDPLLIEEPAPSAGDQANAEASDDAMDWDSAAMPAAMPEAPAETASDLHSEPVAISESVGELGPEGVDANGQRGRIHTVAGGDTLWDISTAYLGTPWVWPAIWIDNDEIDNPHLIVPGERIWITAGEMRKVTREQAEEMIKADNELDAIDALPPVPAELAESGAPSWEPTDAEADLMADDVPAALDQLPVAMPLTSAPGSHTGRSVRVAEREAMGFVASHALDAATSIVDSPSPRTWLVDGDLIYLGSGEGNVEVGDEFTVFRDAEPVRDVDGGRLLGYHVDIMGWAVVREVQADSSIAEIRMSHSEIQRGDRVIPRIVPPPMVPVRETPEGIDGKIVYMPSLRTHMGSGDHVYLNRGELHGFEVGSEVEVFTAGRLTKDKVSGEEVMTPDRVDARLVLVEVKPDTAVGYVVHTSRELEVGDSVRPTAKRVASR